MTTNDRGARFRLARLLAVPYGALAAALVLAFSLLPAAASAATTMPATTARLRVVDLAAFVAPAQGIRLYADGALVATALGFGSSSAYSTVNAGRHHIQIFAAATGKPVLDVTLNLLPGTDYSYLIEGRLRGTVYPVLARDTNTPVAYDQARVRFANAIPDGAAVTATLVGGAASFRTTSFTGLSAYHMVRAGTYTLEVMSSKGQILMTLPGVQLAAGQTYTLFATGLNSVATASTTAQAGTVVVAASTGSEIASAPTIVPAQVNGAASLRLVDLVPAAQIAQPLTLALDGRTFFGSIGYGGATNYLSIPAGVHHIQVYRTTGGTPLLDTTLALAAHTPYSYVLRGLTTAMIGGTLIGVDTTPVAATMARVRFSNMALTGQSAHAVLIGATTLGDAAFGAFTNYVMVPAGRYILQVYNTHGVVLATIANVTLTGGQTYTLFATDLSGKPGAAPVLAISSIGSQFIAPTNALVPQPRPNVAPAPAPVVAPRSTSAATAQLRVANLVRGLSPRPVTVYLDGSPFTAPLTFGGSTVFATLAAGQHRFQVFGANGQLLVNSTVQLQADKAYTFAAEGIQGGATAGALVPVATTTLTAIEARVRFGNAIPGMGRLTASFVNSRVKLGSAPFSGVSSYQPTAAGTYMLMVRNSAGRIILTVPTITIKAGQSYTIFVTNPMGGTGPVGSAAIVLTT